VEHHCDHPADGLGIDFGVLRLHAQFKAPGILMLWSAGWCLLALHYLSPALEPWIAVAPWQSAVNQWLLAAAALLFFSTARVYTEAQPLVRPQIAVGGFFVLWTTAFYLHSVSVSPQLGVALILFSIAWVFYQESRRQETFADLLLAISFLTWGALMIGEVLLPSRVTESLRVLELLPQLFAAALMVMGLYEEEKRRVEHNMLALSNVNLATSGFVGPEIQKMLSHALERVLSVVRMPAGALFLHHGNARVRPPLSPSGWRKTFAPPRRKRGWTIIWLTWFLDWVAWWCFAIGPRCFLGPHWKEKRPSGVSGSSPWARDCARSSGSACKPRSRPSAFCSSATPIAGGLRQRSFACFLRLVIKSGWQWRIVYLVQQSARRTEELHMLNEIGRALSSTLDPEALFETILSELKRLVDVSHFYIALHDAAHNEIRFEIEIHDGVTQPKRSGLRRAARDRICDAHAATSVDPRKLRGRAAQDRFDFAAGQWLFLRCAFAALRTRHRCYGRAKPSGRRI